MKFAKPAIVLSLVAILVSAAACSLFPQINPTPTPLPTQIIAEPTYSPDTIVRQYDWSYAGREWQWTMAIPQSLYDYYTERPRAPTEDYSIYVTNPKDDEYINMLIEMVRNFATDAGYDEWETVNLAVSFVQSLPYTVDSITTPYDEYPRYPIETLVDNGGDCEDTSILMAAILNEMGYGTVLLSLPHHMAVGVLGEEGISGVYFPHNNGNYYYLETTGSDWEIGELPPEYAGDSASIYDIVPVAILTHSWSAESYWHNIMSLAVTVENLGTGTATDIYVYAAFDAGGDIVWNPEESQHFDLGPDQSITITIQLNIPEGEHTRLIVQIVDNGYSVDQSYSEWFDT